MNEEKAEFVSGHGGTTILEIATVLVGIVSCYTLRNVILVLFPRIGQIRHDSITFAFLSDFIILVIPGVLLFTVLADHSSLLCLLFISLVGTLTLYSKWSTPPRLRITFGDSPFPLSSLPYITALRTYTNLFTAIAILAVDFTIFPRRFAKTESYGTGLMDIGVGLFVVAHGLTAPEARGLSSSGSRGYYVWRMIGTVRRVLPLLVLGLIRLVSVKLTGYQEHVTEYGLHWNFFFTIAFVRILSTAIHPLLFLLPPTLPYATLSLLLATLHQLFLSLAGGTEYVMLGPYGDGSRMGLISANREGVVSCLGYLSVYMASIQLGQWLFQKRRRISEFYLVAGLLGVGVVLLWTLTSLCEVYVQSVSRRMANFTFILWLFSQSFLFLFLFLMTDLLILWIWQSHLSSSSPSTLPSPLYSITSASRKPSPTPPSPSPSSHPPHPHPSTSSPSPPSPSSPPPPSPSPPPPPPCVVSAVDYNQLVFFLLANILTGIVNFSMDTLHTSPPLALIVLMIYMCVLVSCAIVLHRYQIHLKL